MKENALPAGIRVEWVSTLEPYVGERMVIIDTRKQKPNHLPKAERTLSARERKQIKSTHNLNRRPGV